MKPKLSSTSNSSCISLKYGSNHLGLSSVTMSSNSFTNVSLPRDSVPRPMARKVTTPSSSLSFHLNGCTQSKPTSYASLSKSNKAPPSVASTRLKYSPPQWV